MIVYHIIKQRGKGAKDKSAEEGLKKMKKHETIGVVRERERERATD